MLIAVINQSTLVTNDQVNTMCQAIQVQMDLHVLPAWNMKAGTIRFYADPTKVPGYAWVVTMLDTFSQAGVLGYHSEDSDKVDAFIFASPVLTNGGVVLYDPNNPQNTSVASVLSHEVCEMIGDRFANAWADGPTITVSSVPYSTYALELCDPVEGNSYAIPTPAGLVSVSNFIFPSWFNPEATVPQNLPFDYLGLLTAPFTMTPGGYMIVRQASNVTQVFGEKVTPQKKEQVRSEWYRRSINKKHSKKGKK